MGTDRVLTKIAICFLRSAPKHGLRAMFCSPRDQSTAPESTD